MIDFTEEQELRLRNCVECPRHCNANRYESAGYCKSPPVPLLSSANLHFGEEPPISGYRGSGTIFFAGCNMACVFCQNYPLSQLGHGSEILLNDLVGKMLALQERGVHNINFVTPSHATIALEVAISKARERGLDIPIVYNSGGYDSISQLKRMEGLVDIYMPDIRYQRPDIAKKYSDAQDYPEINRAALEEMHRQVGDLELDEHGIATRGLLVRHLVLPGGHAGTSAALKFLAEEISPDTHVSLMAQYFPAYKAKQIPGINRRLTKNEWQSALDSFKRAGLNGWVQELH